MSLFDRLATAATIVPPSDLLTGDMLHEHRKGLTAAAVLVAISDEPQPNVVLTVRRAELRRHAGQIALPGGRVDPGETAVGAALREAEEEVGLPRHMVRVAGTLDPYVTITGYDVTPVIALIPAGLSLAPHEAEVAAIFTTPLEHLLDPANHVRRSVLAEGQQRYYYEIMWEERKIWGATAAMIVNLSKRLQWP
jgi:8-oxo-dGTP pyrophosphatase MutT (NUDIX family)